MRCILHIGNPKTGTTAIQQWLVHHEGALLDHGFGLIHTAGRPNNINLAAYFGGTPPSWLNRHRVKGNREARALLDSEAFIENFTREVADMKHSVHTLIITSEQLSAVARRQGSLRELGDLLDRNFDQLQVVAYTRRQEDQLVSGWSTALKSGAKASLANFVDTAITWNRHDYLVMAQRWSEVFGRDSCSFFDYDRVGAGDVRRHFHSSVLGLEETSALTFPAARVNSKYSAAQATAVLWLNRLFPYWTQGSVSPNPRNLRARRLVLGRLKGRGGAITLSRQQREAVQAHYAESNRQYAELFLTHPDG